MSYSSDVTELVKDCILSYFKNKNYSYGGPIPNSVLHTPENLALFNLDICTAMDQAYQKLEKCSPYQKPVHNIQWDVQYVLDIIKECKSLGIPKEFHGGIVLLHIRYCKGFREQIPSYFAVA